MPLLFRRPLGLAGVLAALLLAAVLLPGKISIWLDGDGHTLLTNRAGAPGGGMIRLSPGDLALAWNGRVIGETEAIGRSSSSDEDRFHRELLGARDDILRGELRRGLRSLRRLHRTHPTRPEPAWLLAVVERRRGRLEPAREALEVALQTAAWMPEEWREAAEKLRGEIDAELLHASGEYVEGSRIVVDESEHFTLSYDHHFAGRQFGDRVLSMLEQARGRLSAALGRTLGRPLEIRLYTRAHYLDEYQHRFGFATVGFYDGSIHVVSARHPRSELRALLIHEYAHALFEDALGSHRPFFMNEGIADREEEVARGRGRISRTEWRRLLDADRTGDWVRLDSVVVGFGGLEGKRALLAYLESRATVELIEETHPGAIARWLGRCAEGQDWEEALLAETGWDTFSLERALVQAVRDRFPRDPLAAKDESGTVPPQDGA